MTTGSKQALKKRPRTGSTNPIIRASQACSACAEDHLKCDEEKPCARCRRRNIACVVLSKSTEGVQVRFANPDSPGGAEVNSYHNSEERGGKTDTLPSAGSQPLITPPMEIPASQESDHSQSIDLDGNSHMSPDYVPPGLRDESTSVLFTDATSGVRTPRGSITFGLQTDLDLSVVDLGFLESYNSHVPFEFDEQAPSLPLSGSPYETRETPIQSNPRGARSMQRLRWRFVPAPQDHGYCEHENLLLPNEATGASTLTPQSLEDVNNQSTTDQSLDLHSRDKILGIVLSQIKQPISAVLSSFPSVQLLDSLIRYYLTAPFSTASSWIHRGTFCPQQVCPELLLAMEAAGAVLTPDPSLRKLGFAMQEVVRLQLPSVFEGNNTTIRDLHLHQAYLLYLEIGLWSGNSRKIEISEAFRQPLLTMVRRGGNFHHSAYPPLPARLEESGQSLEDTWRAWAYKEAYKRLVYRLFRLEAQVSMALFTGPLITYTEMGPPLPAPSYLWEANSASQWMETYHSSPLPSTGRIRTLSDRYRDNDLLMAARHGQLSRILECFRMGYRDEVPVQLHFIVMHTYTSLEEVETLATSDDASRAWDQPALSDWFKSEHSRHAIWHAGQVVRGIKALPLQALRDFMAIALYHASLTLWAYGVVFCHSMDNHGQQLAGPALQHKIWLDGLESEDIQRFITLQRGIPVLQGLGHAEETVFVGGPQAVLETMIKVMQQNHHLETSTQTPPLVDNLVHLLEKLRYASK
ncbi:zinc finger protein zas1 [Aspergillus udagawae]|uniref:Zinc finger protein zas1 n=1 Tax=Aspergillus udagawae TaxID=91492 RepID=A0ABQ1BAR9_9EURO|nr:zinc finger protein zas1 [Aspergillus udagawae]